MVYLIRHTTPAVAQGVCYGRLDVPLAASAQEEIAAAVRSIPDVVAIFTSPATRCRYLANAVAAARGAPVVEDPRLLELDFGTWEGVPWSDIPRSEIDRWAADTWSHAPGGGESLSDLWRRVVAFEQDRALADCDLEAGGILIVSHQGPLRVLHCLGQGWDVSRYLETSFGFGREGLRVRRRAQDTLSDVPGRGV